MFLSVDNAMIKSPYFLAFLLILYARDESKSQTYLSLFFFSSLMVCNLLYLFLIFNQSLLISVDKLLNP